MALIVETGAGITDANSYLSESDFEAYCEDRGLTFSGDVEPALVRATAWIEARYGARFSGSPLNGRGQGLSWPRSGATDRAGNAIPSNEVPIEIKRAAAEATLREVKTPGSLMPDQTGGGAAVKRKKLGSMEVEYAVADGAAAAAPSFPLIDGILTPLLGGFGAGMVRIMRV